MVREFKVFGKTFYPYSLLMIAGTVVCFLLFTFISFKRHPKADGENLFAMQMLVIALGLALPAAMIADSAFKMIETGKFVLSGATFYGGALCALAAFALLLSLNRKRQVGVYERLCDIAPCIAAGHFFGRIGCFLGGCCFGSPTESKFGVVFPQGSLPYEYYGGYVAVHPTQLYEAAFLLALFAFLFFLCKKDALPFYFITYGAGRLFIEFFRNDDRGATGLPLSPAQLVSIVLIFLGAIILAFAKNPLRRNYNK